MDMLYYFLNREVDEEGRALDLQPNRVLFEGGKIKLFNG
jgi:hypothetical protein